MAQVNVNPEELRLFIGALKRFRDELDEGRKSFAGAFHHLADTWRDQERDKFEKEFELMVGAITQFVAKADEQLPILDKKATAGQDFLDAAPGLS